jgi:hypothetical protein
MIIRFEPFIRKSELVYQLPKESWIILAEIKDYIERQLRQIKDEIDEAEARQSEEACEIIVHFPKGLEFHGYQEPLLGRMKSSFDKGDKELQILWFRFDDKVKTILGQNAPIKAPI